jgi:hypothetical protein
MRRKPTEIPIETTIQMTKRKRNRQTRINRQSEYVREVIMLVAKAKANGQRKGRKGEE